LSQEQRLRFERRHARRRRQAAAEGQRDRPAQSLRRQRQIQGAAHAGGVVVQAVPDLYAAPSRAFIAALKALPDGGASYKHSRATA